MSNDQTEQHAIEAAYDRLTTSLLPPPGADRLVAARVTQRRRRRRASAGAAGVLVGAVAVGSVALVSGGGGTTAPARVADVPVASGSAATSTPTIASGGSVDRDVVPADLDCTAPLPPNDKVLVADLQRLYDALLAVDGTDGASDDAVRVERDGRTTTAYLGIEDGRPTYALRAERVDGEWRAFELLTCD